MDYNEIIPRILGQRAALAFPSLHPWRSVQLQLNATNCVETSDKGVFQIAWEQWNFDANRLSDPAPPYRIPCAGDYIDELRAFDVIQHVNQPSLLLIEIARVLKFGGSAIVSVPGPGKNSRFDRHRFDIDSWRNCLSFNRDVDLRLNVNMWIRESKSNGQDQSVILSQFIKGR